MKKFKATNEKHFHSRDELVQRFGQNSGETLWRLTDYLLRLARTIREAQTPKDGAVQLYFTSCGKHCTGCPHAYWGIWRKHWRGRDIQFTRYRRKNIRKTARYQGRPGQLANNYWGNTAPEPTVDYDTLRISIDWGLKLLAHREALIQHLQNAERRSQVINAMGSPFRGD